MTTEATPATEAAAAAVTVDPSNIPDAAAPVVEVAHTAAHHAPALAEVFNGLGSNVIYLMGFSFILGSLFTVLMLVLLDYLRRNKQ